MEEVLFRFNFLAFQQLSGSFEGFAYQFMTWIEPKRESVEIIWIESYNVYLKVFNLFLNFLQ